MSGTDPAASAPAGGRSGGTMTRNLNKEDDEAIAKKMFLGGLAFLPWLWAVNAFFYRQYLFNPHKKPKVTYWVRRSLIGFCIVTALLLGWIIAFQTSWRKWGSFGTALLLQVPEEDIIPDWSE